MTAFAAITLLNHAAANVVFAPNKIDAAGVAKWLGAETIYDGKRSATLSVTLPQNGSTVVRIKGRINQPIMDTVDTAKKVGDMYLNIEGVIPKLASETNRLDLLALSKSFLDNPAIEAAFQNLESQY